MELASWRKGPLAASRITRFGSPDSASRRRRLQTNKCNSKIQVYHRKPLSSLYHNPIAFKRKVRRRSHFHGQAFCTFPPPTARGRAAGRDRAILRPRSAPGGGGLLARLRPVAVLDSRRDAGHVRAVEVGRLDEKIPKPVNRDAKGLGLERHAFGSRRSDEVRASR